MPYIQARKGKKGTSYRAMVRLKDFPSHTATFDTRSEAMRWAEEVEHALLHNFPLPGEDLPRDDKSVAEAVHDYIDLMETSRTRSRHTILTDRGTAKRLVKRLGTFSLRTLTREDIEDYKGDRLNEVGPSSIRQDLSMLSRVYEIARVKWRMKDLTYPGKDVPLPAPPPNRKKIIMEGQFDALLRECAKSKNPRLAPLVTLLLTTGMRPEEAVLLRWSQIDFASGIIDLVRTKTDPRRVPVSDFCLAMLLEMKGDAAENDLLFLSEELARKDKPVRFFRRAFEQACIRAGVNPPTKRDVSKKAAGEIQQGIPATRVTLYTLRHSAATYLLMHGTDIRTVADILGHSNISQTMKYTHMVDSHKRAAVNIESLPWQPKEK
jgi:integrase